MSAEECRRFRDREERPAGEGDEAWRRHLRNCPRCARQARLDAMLRKGYSGLPTVRPSPDFDVRLGRRLQTEGVAGAPVVPERPGAVARWTQRLYWLASGATTVVLVGRAVESAPGPASLVVGAGAGLLLGLVLAGAMRVLGVSPGLLIARSL